MEYKPGGTGFESILFIRWGLPSMATCNEKTLVQTKTMLQNHLDSCWVIEVQHLKCVHASGSKGPACVANKCIYSSRRNLWRPFILPVNIQLQNILKLKSGLTKNTASFGHPVCGTNYSKLLCVLILVSGISRTSPLNHDRIGVRNFLKWTPAHVYGAYAIVADICTSYLRWPTIQLWGCGLSHAHIAWTVFFLCLLRCSWTDQYKLGE